MGFSNLTTSTSGNAGQHSARGSGVDRFIVHHAASASLSGVLGMMSSGSREVSANYVIKDDQIVGVVDESRRAWTSGTATWDGRSITVETCNSATGDASGWPISEASYQSLARLIADCTTRYGFPINRDTVIGHRELYTRYGVSYSTACPGGINLDRLVAFANSYQNGGTTAAPKRTGGNQMDLIEEGGKIYLVNEHGMLWVDQPVVDAVIKIKTASPMPAELTLDERGALEVALHTLARSGPLIGDDDYGKIKNAVKS